MEYRAVRMYRIVVLVFLCLGLAHGMRFDKCHIGIKSRSKQNVTLKADCTEGTLYWNYPQGILQVNVMEEGRPFTMCVGYVNDIGVKRVMYITATQRRMFRLPRERNQTICFDSNGGMTLQFFRPGPRKTYLAYIKYTIQQKMGYNELKMERSKLS